MNPTREIRRIARIIRTLIVAQRLEVLWHNHNQNSALHTLPGSLAVTLTSYPPRFPTLALTLKSLLAQRVRPDRIYLWIAADDIDRLPAEVTALQRYGIVIKSCEDIRSYKKIIPALRGNLEDFLVTADDDVFYPRRWLGELIKTYRPGQREVLCGRAHHIRFDPSGKPLPYIDWEFEVTQGRASRHLFPTGIGGVLWPSREFHADVTRRDLFERLCPTADDIWLFWMAALTGARFRKVGARKRFIVWLNTQGVGLFNLNKDSSSNDKQISAMIAHFGMPK